jgi:flagellar motility protein MotE (MotC chaperone)
MPRILPLVGIAIGGVLAINALSGASDLPSLMSGARAFAEEAATKAVKSPAKGGGAKAPQASKADASKAETANTDAAAAPTGDAKNVAATGMPPAMKPQAVCAPTAAELAKEAGLSPAELQVLQNLGERRGQLDKREDDLNTQLALMAAASAKLDAKVKALTGLKADVQGLLSQADGREATEIDRLVKVFEGMKAKDAAPRMVLLDDSVRLPIAAKMKERSLSAIIAQMPPADAKKLTEALAHRFTAAQQLAQNANDKANAAAAATPDPNAATPAATPKAAPARRAKGKQAKAASRKAAPPAAQAAAGTPPASATPAAAPPAPKAG